MSVDAGHLGLGIVSRIRIAGWIITRIGPLGSSRAERGKRALSGEADFRRRRVGSSRDPRLAAVSEREVLGDPADARNGQSLL